MKRLLVVLSLVVAACSSRDAPPMARASSGPGSAPPAVAPVPAPPAPSSPPVVVAPAPAPGPGQAVPEPPAPSSPPVVVAPAPARPAHRRDPVPEPPAPVPAPHRAPPPAPAAVDPAACTKDTDCVVYCPSAPGCCGSAPCGCRGAVNRNAKAAADAAYARTCDRAPRCQAVDCAFRPAMGVRCRAGRCVAQADPTF